MRDWCLVTDIDGTLIGEESSTRALRRAVLRERVALEAAGARLRWVIATGRRLESASEVLKEEGFELGDFDALVTSVGAELYWPAAENPCSVYAAHLGRGGFHRDVVIEALRGCDFLHPQPEEEQCSFKVSYFMADRPSHRERLLAALGTLPFAVETIVSHDEYLDIAPRPGGKGAAVAHLIERWGLSAERTVAAGDSGNDVNMLASAWPSIVVGNGSARLGALRDHPNVYFAGAHHAAGVLEGLRALGFLDASSASTEC